MSNEQLRAAIAGLVEDIRSGANVLSPDVVIAMEQSLMELLAIERARAGLTTVDEASDVDWEKIASEPEKVGPVEEQMRRLMSNFSDVEVINIEEVELILNHELNEAVRRLVTSDQVVLHQNKGESTVRLTLPAGHSVTNVGE